MKSEVAIVITALFLVCCNCRTIGEVKKEEDSITEERDQKSAGEDYPEEFDASKFMLRNGNLYLPQQLVQSQEGQQLLNSMQLLPYYPTGSSQISQDYTASGNRVSPSGTQTVPVQQTAYSSNNGQNQVEQSPERSVPQQNEPKQDRTGVYPVGHYGGGGGYGGDEHGLNKHVSVGLPSIGVNLDPLGILRLLFSIIPRPLLNLNGRVFLGLELGNGLQLGKGPVGGHVTHVTTGGHGGSGYGGKVIHIG